MQSVLFATGNDVKFQSAQKVCKPFGVALEQLSLDIPEIQANDGETVARDKALHIYEQLQKPVIVSDDTWIIPGLGGFPGPYMKAVNSWFAVEDWLRLTAPLADRTIILRQVVVYQDAKVQQIFYSDITGVLLTEIRGAHTYPHTTIVSLDGGETSMAENIARGKSSLANVNSHTSWHDLCEWLATH